jgi:hypothetical protein
LQKILDKNKQSYLWFGTPIVFSSLSFTKSPFEKLGEPHPLLRELRKCNDFKENLP